MKKLLISMLVISILCLQGVGLVSADPSQSGVLNTGEDQTGPVSNMMIQDLKGKTGAVKPNNDFDISFKVKNVGVDTAHNVKVYIDGGQYLIAKSTPFKTFNQFKADREPEELKYTYSASSEAPTGNHDLIIKIEYQDKSGGEIKIYEHRLQVFVDNPPPPTPVEQPPVELPEEKPVNQTVPKIIVDKYSCDPGIVKAGQNFSLNISFLNTNKVKSVHNIKISLTVPEGTETGSVFMPVDSSNTVYIDQIGTQKTVDRQLSFYTIPDASPKTYTMELSFEYEDKDGNPFTATEIIGIPVVQQSRLDVSDIMLPPGIPAFQPYPISFEFYNTGRVTLYNLMVRVEGDFDVQNGQYFVGNFDPGFSDYFDGAIIPTMTGPINGVVIFAFDDAAGEPQEIRREFTTLAEEMDMGKFDPDGFHEIPPDMMEGEDMGKSTGGVGNIIIPIVLGLLAVVAAILVIRRIKKRKGMTLDE